MRSENLLRAIAASFVVVAASACADDSVPGPTPAAPVPNVDPEEFIYPPPDSCAYECETLATCTEQTTPYACPTVGDWAKIPHADACEDWDGSFPAVTPGACSASEPSGEAKKKAGPDPDDPTAFVLPDGRRIHPAGKEWILSDVPGGLTSAVALAPGTSFVLTTDTGYGDHAVHVVDTTLLAAGSDPVVSRVDFAAPETLGSAIVVAPANPPGGPLRVFVAGQGGVIFALTLDATGVLTRDDAADLALPAGTDDAPYQASGLAVSPDGKVVVVSSVQDPRLLTVSIDVGAGYGMVLGSAKLPSAETFGVWFDPFDATGTSVYVSMWSAKKVIAVDVADPAAPAVKTAYTTDKNPEGVAFLDARWLAVADANGDSISIVDRTTGEVTSVAIDAPARPLHGAEPSVLVFDAAQKRLYVALAGENSVAAYGVDLATTPATLTPAGRVGGAWWPSGLAVLPDGSLIVINLRGHGGGPIPEPFEFGDNDIGLRMAGSIQRVPLPTPAELTAGAERVHTDNLVGAQPGAPAVTGGEDDFPVPLTNDAGPSSRIEHIFFILRENKNFDSLLGDLEGVDGEPAYTLKQKSDDMDKLWLNFRAAARAFALSDAYYTDAVFSTQGHVWATYGRSSDFNERTWAISGPRSDSPRSVPGGGVIPVGQPLEGSLFDWLYQNHVAFDILGEIDGQPSIPTGETQPLDIHYPGVGQAIDLNDLPKACYAAGRVRVTCDLGSFVYQTLPNDHTLGVSSSKPTPETYCAVNDEATGIMLHAITHSPLWKSSIVFITEDDPSSGGEHVDGHRTPLIVASPWVRRGYVSKTHIDMASLHKLYAHILGLPYPNRQVEAAMLPLDLFTSTPDYTPFEYEHRKWPLACGVDSAMSGKLPPRRVSPAEEELTDLWDFSEEDRQPGLGAQVWRAMRGRPLEELTPEVRGRLARWRR